MGAKDRQRIADIEAGKVASIRSVRGEPPAVHYLQCHLCGSKLVPEQEKYNHVRECWQIDIKDGDRIPSKPPDDVIQRYLERKSAGK